MVDIAIFLLVERVIYYPEPLWIDLDLLPLGNSTYYQYISIVFNALSLVEYWMSFVNHISIWLRFALGTYSVSFNSTVLSPSKQSANSNKITVYI